MSARRDETARRLHGYRERLDTVYPGAFAALTRTHTLGKRQWPEWCFLPLGATMGAMRRGLNLPWEALDEAEQRAAWYDGCALHALLCWLPGRDVIEPDATLLRELLASPVQGELPAEVFLRLPAYGVYIDLHGEHIGEGDLRTPFLGVFVHLEHDARLGPELRFVFDDGDAGAMVPLGMRLGGSVEDGLRLATGANAPAFAAFLGPVLSVVLYVCSQNADWEGPRGKPQRANPKAVRRALHPQKPGATTWVLGRRLGAAARGADADGQPGPGSGGTVRPHVRRGHWHLYWTGPGRQVPVVRYVLPTLVAQGGEGPVVVRKV